MKHACSKPQGDLYRDGEAPYQEDLHGVEKSPPEFEAEDSALDSSTSGSVL